MSVGSGRILGHCNFQNKLNIKQCNVNISRQRDVLSVLSLGDLNAEYEEADLCFYGSGNNPCELLNKAKWKFQVKPPQSVSPALL